MWADKQVKGETMTGNPSGREPGEARSDFSQGQSVRIIEGPFTDYVGTVSESNDERRQVTVLVSFFGKPTSIVVDFSKVENFD